MFLGEYYVVERGGQAVMRVGIFSDDRENKVHIAHSSIHGTFCQARLCHKQP